MSDREFTSQLLTQTLDAITYIQEKTLDEASQERSYRQPDKPTSDIERKIGEAQQKIEKEVKPQKQLRDQFCAILSSLSGDAFDIAKAIVPTLITLSATQIISISLEPFAIAIFAIALGRMGVAALCSDSD